MSHIEKFKCADMNNAASLIDEGINQQELRPTKLSVLPEASGINTVLMSVLRTMFEKPTISCKLTISLFLDQVQQMVHASVTGTANNVFTVKPGKGKSLKCKKRVFTAKRKSVSMYLQLLSELEY